MRHLITLKDWYAIALRQAAELAGTPEGAEKLTEAKRYELLLQVLTEQEQELKDAHEKIARAAGTASKSAVAEKQRIIAELLRQADEAGRAMAYERRDSLLHAAGLVSNI